MKTETCVHAEEIHKMKTKESEKDEMSEQLLQYVLEYMPDNLKEKVGCEIEKVQNIAFMEGYQYAINILEQSRTGIKYDAEKDHT